MKRIYLLIIALIGLCQAGYSQNRYSLDITACFITSNHHMECETRMEYTIYGIENNSAEKILYSGTILVNGEMGNNSSQTHHRDVQLRGYPTKIQIVGYHQDNRSGRDGCGDTEGKGVGYIRFDTGDYLCSTKSATDFFGNYGGSNSYFKVDLRTIGLDDGIAVTLNGNPIETLFESEKVKVEVPSGYHPSTYKWQYRIGDGSTGDLPSSYQGLSSFEICSRDLPGLQEVAGKQTVYLIFDAGCAGVYTKPLTVMSDAPSIVSVDASGHPLCKNDLGTITVQLSRALYPGEFVNFHLYDGDNPQDGSPVKLSIPRDQITTLGNNSYKVSGIPTNVLLSAAVKSYYENEEQTFYSDLTDKYCYKGFTVLPPPSFTAEILVFSDPICVGGNDGTVTARAKGGSGLYKMKCVSVDDDTEIIESGELKSGKMTVYGLKSGSYYVYVYDSNGCEIEGGFLTFNLYDPENTVEVLGVVDYREPSVDENREDTPNGLLTAAIGKGESPYKVIWREGSGEGTVLHETTITGTDSEGRFVTSLENVVSGNYYLEVEDASGCRTGSILNLPQAPEIYVSLSVSSGVQCAADQDGSLDVTVDGGYGPYNLVWYKSFSRIGSEPDIESSSSRSGLGIGEYRVLATDSRGSRSWSNTVYIQELVRLNMSFEVQALKCRGDENGSLKVNVTGGAAPYTYEWFDSTTGDPVGNGSNKLEGLGMGTYSVLITEASGCTGLSGERIIPPLALEVHHKVTPPSCNGMDNGVLEIGVAGGTAPYTILWEDSTDGYRREVPVGKYTVSVTDRYGCETVRKEYEVKAPDPVSARIVRIKNLSAFGRNDGVMEVNVSGGTPDYQVVCMKSTDWSVKFFPLKNTSLEDGSEQYEFGKLPEGTYVVEVKDKNFRTGDQYLPCRTLLEGLKITSPPKLEVTASLLKPVACYGGNDGKIVAHAKGGTPLAGKLPYKYEWFRVEGTNKTGLPCSDSIYTEASKGRYHVRVTDENGVTAYTEITVDQPRQLQLRLETKDVICGNPNSGSVRSTVSGGESPYSYRWSNGDTVPHLLEVPKGRYSLTVTDKLGCSISLDTIVKNPTEVRFNPTIYTESCSGHHDASIYLMPEGGELPYTYDWSHGGNQMFADSLAPGTYTVTITDAKQCISDTTFVIPELPPITVSPDTLVQPRAFGYSDGRLIVGITGGYDPYRVIWSDQNNQVLLDDSARVDNGKAVTRLENLPTGTYSLRIEDSNYPKGSSYRPDSCGCLFEFSIFLPEPPKLEVTIAESHFISCYLSNDGEITAEATGGVPFEDGLPYRFTWYRDNLLLDDSGSELSGLGQGIYKLKITDANGIESWSNELSLMQPGLLEIETSAADLRCSRDQDGWVSVSVKGGTAPYTYEWSTGDTTPRVEGLPRGKYMVWVRDSRGCEQIGNVRIVKPDSMTVTATLVPPACYEGSDGEIHIQVSGGMAPYRYEWNTGHRSGSLSGLSKGTYTLAISDADECNHETFTYELSEPEYVAIDLGEDRTLCVGQTHEVVALCHEPAHSFNWISPQGSVVHQGEIHTLSDPGTYRVEAVTAKGCKASGEITISRDHREVAADFMVASKVPVNDNIYFVNITDPAPDSIVWLLPEEEAAYRVVSAGEDVLELIFSDYGEYVVGMQSYSGSCYETVYKTVKVMDKIDIEGYEDADGPMLRSFSVSPNPAVERFTAEIELGKNSPAVLLLIDSGTGRTLERRVLSKGHKFTETFELEGSAAGTCVLHLATPEVRSSVKVIVKN